MIKNDFKIDFDKKIITYNPKGSGKRYTKRELYSYLQGLLDEPENMKYDIPMVAKSKTKFEFINGWKINEKASKYILSAKSKNSSK